MRYYNIFISHSWKHSDDYNRLVALLDKEPYFRRNWRDYSVPKNDPLDVDNDLELKRALEGQIRLASVILIPAGMYARPENSEWINKEINIANTLQKPIIAIKPWGNENLPSNVIVVANEVVGWNGNSIVEAIKRLAG